MVIAAQYISILQGKEKQNNLKILKTLTQQGPLTITDLTKSFLKKGTSRYSKEFASLNSTIYRRVKALTDMIYLTVLKRNGQAQYDLSLKGKILAWAIWPDLGERQFVFKTEDKDNLKGFGATTQGIIIDNDILAVDPDMLNRILIRPFERLVNSGRINLDAISEEELFAKIKQEWLDSAQRIQTGEMSEQDWFGLKRLLKDEIKRLRDKLTAYEELWRTSFPGEPIPQD